MQRRKNRKARIKSKQQQKNTNHTPDKTIFNINKVSNDLQNIDKKEEKNDKIKWKFFNILSLE